MKHLLGASCETFQFRNLNQKTDTANFELHAR